ncbi:MAG: LysR family transcriptional regulator [Gemmataceae bacterium]
MARIYYKGIQLEQIRSFCRVARVGSFTVVAQELGVSTATVCRQVRALEREYKATLLVRDGRAMVPTREGQRALELLEPHLHGLAGVADQLHDERTLPKRQLTVASTSMLLMDHLAEPLREYAASLPAVLLSLVNEPADLGLGRVAAGEADLGVVTYLPDEPRHPQLAYEDLREFPWLLATARKHALSRRRRLALEDLAEWPWIMPARETQPRRHLEDVLRRHGLRERIRVVLESRHFALTQTCVAIGLGITLLYGLDAKRPPAGLWLRSATDWFGATPVAIVTRKGAAREPHVEAFLKIARRRLGRKK